MAVPKRRTSASRSRMRRFANSAMRAPQLSTCPQCNEPKLPHRVCGNCGYYAGRQVIDFSAEEDGKR